MKTLGAIYVTQLIERCEAFGVNVAMLHESAGLVPAQLADPDGRVPFEVIPRLIVAAERLSGDALIGLRAGLSRPPRGLLAYLFRSQQNVKDGLVALSQSVSLAVDPLRFEVGAGAGWASLRVWLDEPESDAPNAVREYIVGFMIRFLQEAVRQFVPREVSFMHAPRAPLAEYQRLLGVPPRFRRNECAIGIAPELLPASLATANPVVAHMLGEHIERQLSTRRASEFRASVEHAMELLLRDSCAVRREPVARRLGVSVRTLQRKLAAKADTFHDVRDAVLERSATALLRQQSLSLAEVAQRVGFADEDAFGKAWKRWTGSAPSEFRRRGASSET